MAMTHAPDRAFGMLLLVQFGLGGLGVMFLPTLVPAFGTRILFLSLAALTACALAAIFAIPRLADPTPVERGARPPRTSTAATTTTLRLLLARFLFTAAHLALSASIL